MALDKEVEVFSKLQQREIMHSIVKLHDLVDFVEPLWRGMADASTLGLPRDGSIKLDEPIWNHDEDVVDVLANPREANLGLG